MCIIMEEKGGGGARIYNIGIDLGGTNLRAGVVDEAGHVLGRASVATPRGTAALVEAIASAVDRAASSAGLTLSDIRTVGLACGSGCWFCRYANFHLREHISLDVGVCCWPRAQSD